MALLVVSIVPMSAKVKERNLCQDMLYFEGEVVKNKETKLKEPTGEGKLFLPRNWKNKEYDIYIQGEFNGNKVNNGSFCISDYSFQGQKAVYTTIFQGNIAYAYSYDKAAKTLTLTIELLEGMLFADGEGRIPVSQNSSIIYAMKFKKGDWIPYKSEFQIYPQSISFKSQNPPKEPSMGSLMESYEWVADMSYPRGEWDLKCKGGVLKNGMKCTFIDRPPYFTLYGNNHTYMRDGNLRLPLTDGGFFEWIKDGHSTLYYPNGDTYEGSFKVVPFKFSDVNYNEHFYCSAKWVEGFDCGDRAETNEEQLLPIILRSSTADYVPLNGSYKNSSGKVERVKNGQFPDRALAGKKLGNTLPDYESVITNATRLSESDKFRALCEKDFWAYIDKPNLSELDKEIFKKSPEYQTLYSNYQSALNGLFYEIQPYYIAEFTTKQAKFETQSVLCSLPIFTIEDARGDNILCGFPIKQNYLKKKQLDPDWFVDCINFIVPSTDLDYLKYLQDADKDKELSILFVMKPGTSMTYSKHGYEINLAVPVAIYLLNNKTQTIIADFSNYIDKTDFNKYRPIFARIIKQEIAEDKRNELPYHQQAIRKACPLCSGRGYLSGYMSQDVPCTQCHGKGYVYTHYY